MTVASALSRAIDQAAGQRRAVTGPLVRISHVSFAESAYALPRLACWSNFGMDPDTLAPSRRPPTP